MNSEGAHGHGYQAYARARARRRGVTAASATCRCHAAISGGVPHPRPRGCGRVRGSGWCPRACIAADPRIRLSGTGIVPTFFQSAANAIILVCHLFGRSPSSKLFGVVCGAPPRCGPPRAGPPHAPHAAGPPRPAVHARAFPHDPRHRTQSWMARTSRRGSTLAAGLASYSIGVSSLTRTRTEPSDGLG